jgi:hypothetical protein
MARGGRGPTVLTMPSRFITEIDGNLVERGEIESDTAIDFDDSWSSTTTVRERRRQRKSWFAE